VPIPKHVFKCLQSDLGRRFIFIWKRKSKIIKIIRLMTITINMNVLTPANYRTVCTFDFLYWKCLLLLLLILSLFLPFYCWILELIRQCDICLVFCLFVFSFYLWYLYLLIFKNIFVCFVTYWFSKIVKFVS
jgi:hypothetical protein